MASYPDFALLTWHCKYRLHAVWSYQKLSSDLKMRGKTFRTLEGSLVEISLVVPLIVTQTTYILLTCAIHLLSSGILTNITTP